MGGEKEEKLSMDPDHPEEEGLIHFYQATNEAGEKQWKFLTPDQYEDQKDSLPDVCFAARHPDKEFVARVARERQGTATEEDRNNTSFPDLNAIIPQLQFNAGAAQHAQKTTNSGAAIAKDSPLYYSYSMISEAEQKIFAKESEVLSGDQAWDMNPVIYYRIKKPVSNLDSLPILNLAEHYSQAEETEKVSFTIQNQVINPAEIAAIEITDQAALARFEQFKNFTQE